MKRFTPGQVRVASLLLVAAVAALDIVTGSEISVLIFFLIPVAISTWYGSRRDGIITGCISAFAWLVVDSNSRIYINPVAPYWNALVRLGMFLVIEELLNQLRIRFGIKKTLSRTDSLTGLQNARGFFEQAEILFGLAARHNRSITLAYLDLDNFKKVNDELGHGGGDKVLRAVGNTIQSSLRATDLAGRLGGDEFGIVLPESDEAGARSVFDTLRATILLESQKNHWPISLSIGVVSFAAPSPSLAHAIEIADSVMYQVKARGKDNIIFEQYPAN
ncbi:MAG: GGDEF domain-containing protein [Gallionella sp.]